MQGGSHTGWTLRDRKVDISINKALSRVVNPPPLPVCDVPAKLLRRHGTLTPSLHRRLSRLRHDQSPSAMVDDSVQSAGFSAGGAIAISFGVDVRVVR